jgi:hypothetical protein
MIRHINFSNAILFATFSIFFVSLSFADPNNPPVPPQQDNKQYFVTLKDFTEQEIKGLGFTLSNDMTISVVSVGGGTENFWSDEKGKRSVTNTMYAYSWIINADTREVAWEMTMENTKGKDDRRTFEGEILLKKGSYEVYFSAHTYTLSSGLSFYSNNIDRRLPSRRPEDKFFDKLFGLFDADYRGVYSRFMERAKDTWGIHLNAPKGQESAVKVFNAPKKPALAVYAATGIGDAAVVKKNITVNRDITVNVYALGEGRGKYEMFDYGWITNDATRERVWDMNNAYTTHAGGAMKNVLFNGDVRLAKGTYELNYVTDDSHSRDDWNASPPYDPFNYGITIVAKNEADKAAVSISDYAPASKNVIVQLVKARDNDFLQGGFSLKEESRLHVYAIGEASHSKDRLADFGWIINAKTRERVWEMKARNTLHAGGGLKNRLADEVIVLPRGEYLVYYQTDDSHSYNDWNDDKPFDADMYGITVMGAGENFSTKNVVPFSETESANVLVQMIRVRDDKHVRQKFTMDKTAKVRVYAIGEGVGNSMADYAWIENAKTGEVVWEMTYRTTMHAGGAKKNRMYDRPLLLEKGEYEVHYQTDDSHAFDSWNSDPPDDRSHWGVTIYKE